MVFLNFSSICHFIANTFMVVPTSNVTVLQVHVFIIFQKEIHVGIMVLEFVTFVHMVAGRSHVGLTICNCFLIKHNKNPDNDGCI